MSKILTVDDLEFEFKIISMDIEQGTLLIEYDPVDANLMPITLNCLYNVRPLFTYPEGTYLTHDEVPFEDSLEFTVRQAAPVTNWKRHQALINNFDKIQEHIATGQSI